MSEREERRDGLASVLGIIEGAAGTAQRIAEEKGEDFTVADVVFVFARRMPRDPSASLSSGLAELFTIALDHAEEIAAVPPDKRLDVVMGLVEAMSV